MIAGFSILAIAKRAFNVFSDSPTYFDIKSDAETLKNVPFFCYVTHAFAKYVFPVPGGWIVKKLRHREEFLSKEFFAQ